MGKRALAINSRRNRAILAVLVVLVILLAWYDGGKRPLREIVEPVAVPESLQ